ncbi:SDR family oxidoreductase [Biostraticola tofi]|uniref:Uncharacterized protein YbjT (DUF2867 family) n=1 Tax=Biostraticola tofi TaxID=466109 RepID=A0A4R3YP84_9GAMM|nr:SDR family oxidoreductase [Biostraticola tofi]TCV92974.1 uncharacterized protein YbjT (DUF2867 family) [Biostraticola tofi]
MKLFPWLIFGGASGVGRALVKKGLQQERPMIALVRNSRQAEELRNLGLTVIAGDALDPQSVRTACLAAGPHARIISTLGSAEADYTGNRLIIDTAEQCDLRHMLLVTSIGCGDSWPSLSARARQVFGQAVREKSLAESWLQSSRLNGCILRPGGLRDGAATGQSIRVQGQAHGVITREDVADHITQLVDDEAAYGQIYAVIDPGLTMAVKP